MDIVVKLKSGWKFRVTEHEGEKKGTYKIYFRKGTGWKYNARTWGWLTFEGIFEKLQMAIDDPKFLYQCCS